MFFGFLKRKRPELESRNKAKTEINGGIGYYGLEEWWLESFSDAERQKIMSKYPLENLLGRKIQGTSQSLLGYLTTLASWFKSPEDKAIRFKIIRRAEESITQNSSVVDLHFFYLCRMEAYYRYRDEDDGALAEAIKSAKNQIDISLAVAKEWSSEFGGNLPAHSGFKQLCIIREKEGIYAEAIELAERAAGEGWAGDWDKRIERMLKRNG